MKKNFLALFTIVLLLACFFVVLPVQSIKGNILAGPLPTLSTDQTTTVTVTIVKIDLTTRTITLKDQNGKIYVFSVDSTIDLSKFKVGQSATATISTTYTTDKVTRARITKSQLIKLQ